MLKNENQIEKFRHKPKLNNEVTLTVPIKDPPLVSIIVPTFNRPAFLQKALNSIIAQTFKHLEIVVVNDAGEDVRAIIRNLNDARVIYFQHKQNLGLGATRNTGIQHAKGKYIAYLDDDDVFYPDHLETLISFLEKNPNYWVAYTDSYYSYQEKIGGQYKEVKRDLRYSFDFDYKRILIENFIPSNCIVHRKDCLSKVGCFNPNLKLMEDWDLWIRISRVYKFRHIKKVTCEVSWRTDGSSMSSSGNEAFSFGYIDIVYRYKKFIKGKTLINSMNAHLAFHLKSIREKLQEGLMSGNQDTYKLLGNDNLTQLIQKVIFLKEQYSKEFQSEFRRILFYLNNYCSDNS
jgi:glycosyltransferase involved in cell wall biosynthesis